MRAAWIAVWVAGALAMDSPDASAASSPSVRWEPDPSTPGLTVVEVAGLSAATLRQLQQADWQTAQWQRLLAVYAESGHSTADKSLPPMLGRYRVDPVALRFIPQFPLEPGVSYRAVFRPGRLPGGNGSGEGSIPAVFRIEPHDARPTTVVSTIYPSGDVVPENLLKFYLHFSAPMSRGHIYNYIHLLSSNGRAVEQPFLEIGEELWDPAMTRLTLFIDPGRIKRGVRPLEETGPALEAGQRYTLVIDSDWRDGTGKRLKESFRKEFKASAADREPPDPERWRIQAPAAGRRDALEVHFDKPMDEALGRRMIRVTQYRREAMAGTTWMPDHERQWNFIPNAPWKRGVYQLVVQKTIEDLAGNNIGQAFDVDLFERVESERHEDTVTLKFEVR